MLAEGLLFNLERNPQGREDLLLGFTIKRRHFRRQHTRTLEKLYVSLSCDTLPFGIRKPNKRPVVLCLNKQKFET